MSDCHCKTCGEFTLSPTFHRCPPEWEVREEDDDTWQAYRGREEDDAAVKYAEDTDNNGDGPRERVVLVRKPGTDEVKRFEITFDYSIDYHAREQ